MILNDNDYQNIADLITEGRNHIEYKKDGEELHLDCDYETEGSWEDDYYNGTGAYVEFSRCLYVEFAECYDSEGRKTDFELDENKLERMVA